MISDNHNAYNNYNNYIDEYELTNGYAVVDRNFSIVTANEPMSVPWNVKTLFNYGCYSSG